MRRILNYFRAFGIDPRKAVFGLIGIPRYFSDLFLYLRKAELKGFSLSPALTDFNDSSGAADGHYFWQDLICARWIYGENPESHIDIGSRVDGFIAHLLTFRKVQILDIRELRTNVDGLTSIVEDLQGEGVQLPVSDSISSLHSIEHFGLGRYRDTVDPSGHVRGLLNISKMVRPGGHLYVSFPIGEEKVEFNAQRIIDPLWAVNHLTNFELESFVLIPWKGEPVFNVSPREVNKKIRGQAGLYKFKKKHD
ncbi:Protein of unknown function DUF268, Caenorhabditis species [Candidatus Nanopelagicaceae bacterium]